MHLKFSDVNDAFEVLVRLFARGVGPQTVRGNEVTVKSSKSRVGDVLYIEEPVILTYKNPQYRVLYNTARDANPFFHLFEALWMLSGSNHIQALQHFSSKIGDFCSDDGVTANGAYGYRWRHGLADWQSGDEVDQIQHLINHIRALPETRRAVLQMWNTQDDLMRIDGTSHPESVYSKDVCCLASETSFRSPEGDARIDKLANKFQSTKGFKFPIYSVDTTTGEQNISWMTNAWKVGVKQVYRLKFDDGSSVKMTGDHVVFRKKKLFEGKRCIGVSVEEVQVSDLSEGDRLLATLSENAVSRVSRGRTGGYRVFKKNVFKNTGGKNMKKEHIEYMSLFHPKTPGYSIHHINGDKLDNRLENLIQMKNSEHFALNMMGKQNPHSRMTTEEKTARGKKHSVSLKAHWEGMDEETRKAYARKKVDRTDRQQELVEEHKSKKSNHKIISIEKVGAEAVYDFTVPGRHNAVLSNGVVVHNCNTSAMFMVRTENGVRYLDMTVTNRSNDLILGCLGANYVHFGILQEYMATALGMKVGVYNQMSNNLHVYTEANGGFHPHKWLVEYEGGGGPIRPKTVFLSPLFTDQKEFDADVEDLVQMFSRKELPMLSSLTSRHWAEGLLRDTVIPMMCVFLCHKMRSYSDCEHWVSEIKQGDWKFAAQQWIRVRKEKWDAKQTAGTDEA